MKIKLLIFLFLGCFISSYASDEIVIEMMGEPTKQTSTISLWDKTTKKLEKLFKDKDKTYLLYTADSVPTKEQVLYSTSKKYLFIQYGTDKTEYRKFLFDNSTEKFLACASNLKEVFALNEKYKINIPFELADLLQTYPEQTSLVETLTTKESETISIYSFENKESKATIYFAFNANHVLLKTIESEKDLETYKKGILPPPPPKKEHSPHHQKRLIFSGVLEGGTEWDNAHRPRVHRPQPKPKQKP